MTRAPAGNSRGWIPWKGREKAGMDCRRGSRAGKCRESRICISVQDLHLSAGSLTSASALPRWPFPCLLRSFVGRMVASGMSSSFASFSELLCCLPRHGWEGVEQAFLSFWSRGCLWGECVTGMETNQDSRAAPRPCTGMASVMRRWEWGITEPLRLGKTSQIIESNL